MLILFAVGVVTGTILSFEMGLLWPAFMADFGEVFGLAFAIETKTHSYHDGHLASVQAQAAWLERRRCRWCPRGARPVLCVTRGSRLEHLQDEVLVVSVHQLVGELRTIAASVRRPAFLGPIGSPT